MQIIFNLNIEIQEKKKTNTLHIAVVWVHCLYIGPVAMWQTNGPPARVKHLN